MRKINLALFTVLCLLIGTVFASAGTTTGGKDVEPVVAAEPLELEMPKVVVGNDPLANADVYWNDSEDEAEEVVADDAEEVTDRSDEPYEAVHEEPEMTAEEKCKRNEYSSDEDEWYHVEDEECTGHKWEEADTFKFCTKCGATEYIEHENDEDAIEIIIESSDEDIEVDLGEVDLGEDDIDEVIVEFDIPIPEEEVDEEATE